MLQNIYYSKVLKAINSSFNTVLFNNLLNAYKVEFKTHILSPKPKSCHQYKSMTSHSVTAAGKNQNLILVLRTVFR